MFLSRSRAKLQSRATMRSKMRAKKIPARRSEGFSLSRNIPERRSQGLNGFGEYGDFGRSLRKSIKSAAKSVVSAPKKAVKSVVTAPRKAVQTARKTTVTGVRTIRRGVTTAAKAPFTAIKSGSRFVKTSVVRPTLKTTKAVTKLAGKTLIAPTKLAVKAGMVGVRGVGKVATGASKGISSISRFSIGGKKKNGALVAPAASASPEAMAIKEGPLVDIYLPDGSVGQIPSNYIDRSGNYVDEQGNVWSTAQPDIYEDIQEAPAQSMSTPSEEVVQEDWYPEESYPSSIVTAPITMSRTPVSYFDKVQALKEQAQIARERQSQAFEPLQTEPDYYSAEQEPFETGPIDEGYTDEGFYPAEDTTSEDYYEEDLPAESGDFYETYEEPDFEQASPDESYTDEAYYEEPAFYGFAGYNFDFPTRMKFQTNDLHPLQNKALTLAGYGEDSWLDSIAKGAEKTANVIVKTKATGKAIRGSYQKIRGKDGQEQEVFVPAPEPRSNLPLILGGTAILLGGVLFFMRRRRK